MIDPYQVYEARAMGADAILLIVAALSVPRDAGTGVSRPPPGHGRAGRSHDGAELDDALHLKTPLIGINNRNLRTFEVSLETTLGQLVRIPADRIVVTESGILTPADVALMRQETSMPSSSARPSCAAHDPGAELARLFA